ncbi:MAG: hypothetical protein R3E35_00270 [Rhodocyclaceae bacterium]|jgi:hypothetical protein
MRRYGNLLGVLLTGLALMLGVALLVRMAWHWSIPDVFGLGPVAFRHLLGLVLLGAVSAGLLRLGRQRFTGRW